MPIEIQQALIALGGSIVGAIIGSGIITHILNIKQEKRLADIETLKNLKSTISDDDLTYLREAEFYEGIPKRIVDSLYEINYLSRNPAYLLFHSKKLALQRNSLLSAIAEFSNKVPAYTLPEGNGAGAVITTRTSNTPSNEELRKRNRKESDELIPYTRNVYEQFVKLDTIAMRLLINVRKE